MNQGKPHFSIWLTSMIHGQMLNVTISIRRPIYFTKTERSTNYIYVVLLKIGLIHRFISYMLAINSEQPFIYHSLNI